MGSDGANITDAMCESHCSHPRDDSRPLVERATGLPYHSPHPDTAGARLSPNLRRWAASQRDSRRSSAGGAKAPFSRHGH